MAIRDLLIVGLLLGALVVLDTINVDWLHPKRGIPVGSCDSCKYLEAHFNLNFLHDERGVKLLDSEVERVLRAAGWQPGRHVDTATWRDLLEGDGLLMHEAAESFLGEFGGLSVAHGGAGISRAREPFEFDPLLGMGEGDRFSEWGEIAGRSLFPIGELDRGRFFLGIDEVGMIYMVADWLATFGVGQAGIERLVLGVAPEVLFP